jgi:hypothetical protein
MTGPPVSTRWRVATLVLLSAVVLHFTVIGTLIAAPWLVPGPVQLVAARYGIPWFTQDWRLFGPAPDVHDYALFARGAYRDGDRLVRTPWIAVLDPLLAAAQANRLSPAAVRLEIAHKATLFSTRVAGPLALVPSGRQALAERWATVDRQPAVVILLERLASVALAEAHPDLAFETVQVMVSARTVVAVGAVSPDDSEIAFVLDPVPFQHVAR